MVVLVNPGVNLARSMGGMRGSVTPLAPLSIAYLAAVLEREGLPVTVIDQYAMGLSPEALAARIAALNAAIVGFSVLTPTYNTTAESIGEIRKRMGADAPKIVMGNTHACVYYRDILQQGLAHHVVLGEGERSFPELVRALLAGDAERAAGINGVASLVDGEVVCNERYPQIRDLDTLPFPAWHLFDHKLYRAMPVFNLGGIILPMILRRGCSFRCTFCAQNINYNRITERSYDNFLDEIERNLRDFGVNTFLLQDANFPLDEEDAVAFSRAIRDRGFDKKVRWVTEMRVDMATPEVMREMKTAGCHMVMYGYESGDQEILDSLRKKATLDQGRAAAAAAKQAGVLVFGQFIIGLPGETPETIERTVRYAIEVSPEIAKFSRFTPYPGSALFDELMAGREFDFERNTPWSVYNKADGLNYVPEGMSADEIVKLQRNAVLRFYLRPRRIANYLAMNLRNPAAIRSAMRAIYSLSFNRGVD